MRKTTREPVYTYIKTKQPVRTINIVKHSWLSKVRVHAILTYLLENDLIYKTWSAPKVFYYATWGVEFSVLKHDGNVYICNARSNGKLLTTVSKHIKPWFIWIETLLMKKTHKQIEDMLEDVYVSEQKKLKPNHLFNLIAKIVIQNNETLQEGFDIYMKNNFESIDKKTMSDRFYAVYFTLAQHIINTAWRMDASIKLTSLRPLYTACDEDLYLEHIYYAWVDKIDAHKTINYERMETIKEFQDPDLIDQYTQETFGEEFLDLLEIHGFDAIVVVPNNVKRQISFNEHISTYISKITLIPQIYIDTHVFPWRKPQKKISWICKRIENAMKLFSVADGWTLIPKKILIVDDVLGSGATMNTIAKKLHQIYPWITCSWFALLWSYRTWFDVVTGI